MYYIIRNQIKIAPFHLQGVEPIGAFINTTFIDPQTGRGDVPVLQTVTINSKSQGIMWPSAEHAYHAQKIIFLKGKMLAKGIPHTHPAQKVLDGMLLEISATKKRYSLALYNDMVETKRFYFNRALDEGCGFWVKNAYEFDALCEVEYHLTKNTTGLLRKEEFIRKVVQLKIEQYPKLASVAIDSARNGIIPIFVDQEDNDLGSGMDGDGQNLLGLAIYQEGQALLREKGETAAIDDPKVAYQAVTHFHKTFSHLVRHTRSASSSWYYTSNSSDKSKKMPFILDSDTEESFTHPEHPKQRLIIKNDRILRCEQYKEKQWVESSKINEFKGLVKKFWKMLSNVLSEDINALQKFYKHATHDQGRTFFINKAEPVWEKKLNSSLYGLSGDRLKTQILLLFKREIEKCELVEELTFTRNMLVTTGEYRILHRVQGLGLFSRLTQKTSSTIAFDKMIEEKRKEIQEKQDFRCGPSVG